MGIISLRCGSCGNPLERAGEECLKCGNREAVRADGKRVLEVDVAHGGETVERALAKLEQAVDEVLKAGYARLRVIHGMAPRPTIPTGSKGLSGPNWKGFSRGMGGDWHGTRTQGRWSGFLPELRKNWGAASNCPKKILCLQTKNQSTRFKQTN